MVRAPLFESKTARLLRRNRSNLGASLVPFLIGLLFVPMAIATSQPVLLFPTFPLGIIGLISLYLAYRANTDPVPLEGGVTVDEAGLRAGEHLYPRGSMVSALVGRGETPHVTVERRWPRPPLRVNVADEEEARALVGALGFDPSESVAELRAATGLLAMSERQQFLRTAGPIIGAIALFYAATPIGIGTAVGMGTVGAVAATAFILTLTRARMRVTIGADGIETQWFGKREFYPMNEIEDARTYRVEQPRSRDVVGTELVLTGGRRARIPCGYEDDVLLDPSDLAERIREARDLAPQSASPPPPALLARGGRPIAAWIRALRAVGSGANADHRTAPVDVRDLLRIAEDATSSPQARAAAAIAAVPELGGEARDRIRIAAETTVSAPLRIALERIADESVEDAAIEEALGDLERSTEVRSGPRGDQA